MSVHSSLPFFLPFVTLPVDDGHRCLETCHIVSFLAAVTERWTCSSKVTWCWRSLLFDQRVTSKCISYIKRQIHSAKYTFSTCVQRVQVGSGNFCCSTRHSWPWPTEFTLFLFLIVHSLAVRVSVHLMRCLWSSTQFHGLLPLSRIHTFGLSKVTSIKCKYYLHHKYLYLHPLLARLHKERERERERERGTVAEWSRVK